MIIRPIVKNCKDCKFSIQRNNKTLCTLFTINENNKMWYNAELVRENINLCGPDAIYFKQIKNVKIKKSCYSNSNN